MASPVYTTTAENERSITMSIAATTPHMTQGRRGHSFLIALQFHITMIEPAAADAPIMAIVPLSARHVEDCSRGREPFVEFHISRAGNVGFSLIHQRSADREIGMKADPHRRRLPTDVLHGE